jgi:saccharopine dehydrogenase-like NADP-dependent oxidoreductase
VGLSQNKILTPLRLYQKIKGVIKMKDNLKIAIIGCGGIGSYFIRSLSELIKRDLSGFNRINVMDITIIDYDKVEEKNLLYQNFEIEDLDRNKAEVLADRIGYKFINTKIEKSEQLAEYDLVVICADNNSVRNIIYEAGRPFLDLRSSGKTIMAYLTQKDDIEYLELTKDDGKKGGCQREEDISDRYIQCGNRIISEIGIQFLADYLRGETKQKKLIMTI